MEKEHQLYVVGPPIKINGKKKVRRIKKALEVINVNPAFFELGWLLTIPVPTDDTKEFHLICVIEDYIQHLPVDFAERLEEILYTKPTEDIPE